MCGINGILRLQIQKPSITPESIIKVRDAMQTRGPDDAGIWISDDGDIGLGHRRLSIIDLSQLGHQPMSWANQRYWITYNGEIYNYPQLRNDLIQLGIHFVSQTDTEVILALYELYGESCLSHLRGMYAFAIWDSYEKTLLLARDPYGIKPLYYAATNGYFEFASQVKALECSENISLEVSPAGLVGFFLWGSVPEPYTIRRDISLLPAGHFLYVRGSQVCDPQRFCVLGKPTAITHDTLSDALHDSVHAHLVADVPVGVFLSSGIDSITIATLAQQIIDSPLKTLTVTFDRFKGTPHDEGPLAAEIAKLLKTDHTEVTISSGDFANLWEEIIPVMDQPSIDGFNSYIISKIAYQCGLKVVLSGIGGDELFGGYSTFRDHRVLMIFSKIVHAIPVAASLGEKLLKKIAGERNPKITYALCYSNTPERMYLLKRGLFLPHELNNWATHDIIREGLRYYSPLDTLQKMVDYINGGVSNDPWLANHVWESDQYMRNQLLRDTDWASMAHSLEVRTPLVDVWLRESIAALNFQPARRYGKAQAIKTVITHLPDTVFQRPKTGFQIPAIEWLGTNQQLYPGVVSRQLAFKTLEAFGIRLS
jgi:asparagine synthase (glutamine-hydrolysing)